MCWFSIRDLNILIIVILNSAFGNSNVCALSLIALTALSLQCFFIATWHALSFFCLSCFWY